MRYRIEYADGKCCSFANSSKCDLQIFFEEASGADPNRKEFNRLKAEIAKELWDVPTAM